MKKFNLAFVPKKAEQFSMLAQQYQSVHNYCLGENSIPHVTLCQFYSKERMIDNIWEKACSAIHPLKIKLIFKKISHLSFDGHVFWIALIPEQAPYLTKLHHLILKQVKSIRRDNYDPHLTLFNYLKSGLDPEELLSSSIMLEDEFYLSIGESDKVGQLTKIIAFA